MVVGRGLNGEALIYTLGFFFFLSDECACGEMWLVEGRIYMNM